VFLNRHIIVSWLGNYAFFFFQISCLISIEITNQWFLRLIRSTTVDIGMEGNEVYPPNQFRKGNSFSITKQICPGEDVIVLGASASVVIALL